MAFQKLKRFIQFDTAGWIASSGLLICIVSGILLVIPFDITNPHRSLTEMLLLNPAGTFIRNVHYWSAQLFFVFTILHIYDHLYKSTETNLRKRSTWLILCVAIIVLGYEMISGFILKGDASGVQARRIIASLLESVPLVGKMVSAVFLGTGDNWQPVYIQHVSTGTILLIVAVYDHIRTIWPRLKSFLLILTVVFFISWLFRAPLGPLTSALIKGPWFFIGIQELLHYTAHPGFIIILLGILPVILFFLPRIQQRLRFTIKLFLLAGCIIYLALTITAYLFRGENWQWQGWRKAIGTGKNSLVFDPVHLSQANDSTVIPANQKAEGCLICHSPMKGLSESHNPLVIGCFSCHKGDPNSMNKITAHRRMIRIPGNFSNVSQTCGTQDCHGTIAERMMNSLMTTQSGIIGIDKFVFQETNSLNDSFHIKDLAHSASDTHLRNLCAGCHLGAEKTQTGKAGWLDRGGGCNACHLNYNREAIQSLDRLRLKPGTVTNETHPAIDLNITNERCMSCHSRSGRISLGYEGWNETDLPSANIKDSIQNRILPDGRVLEFIQADIHHQKGMVCIDCHSSYEIMGNGKHTVHKEDAVHIQCIDCHPTGKIQTEKIVSLPDFESQMIASLRNFDKNNSVILSQKSRLPLINTKVDSTGQIILTGKLNAVTHVSKPAGKACIQGKGHQRLSCESCHTAWVAQCIGCHNSYEKESEGFDLLERKTIKGTWIEYAGKNLADPPVLGISTRVGDKVVGAMPGMIMTIDLQSFDKNKTSNFHRLFAPTSAHTTTLAGRSCKSCHTNPLAIGYGRGELSYKTDGKTGTWTFTPRFEMNSVDGLPEDAWIGFLKSAAEPYSTRTTLRPFSVEEQKKILEVGACLTCHNENSNVMKEGVDDYLKIRSKCTDKCLLPSW